MNEEIKSNQNKPLILWGTCHPMLGESILDYLSKQYPRHEYILVERQLERFTDGEIQVRIHTNLRGADLFIIQPTPAPADNLMELLLLIDAAKRASAERITAVIPYFGYQRQDRKDYPRVPISAKLVANLLTTAGASRVLTLDLHAPQIQGFFDIPVDHLLATPVFVKYYLDKYPDTSNLVVVAPDVGGVKIARAFSRALAVPLAIVDKRRDSEGAHAMNIIGNVQDKDILLVDDIIQSGGTLFEAARVIMEYGARSVEACCTHAVFTTDSRKKLESNKIIKHIVVSDSLPVLGGESEVVKILSVAALLGEAIFSIHHEQSVARLFLTYRRD